MRYLAAAALIVLGACGGRQTASGPEPRLENCGGNSYVEVMNDWSREVEVYAFRAGESTGSLLGSVRPNQTSEFLIPHDAVRAAAVQPGLSTPVEIPSRARSLVRLRYVCR